MFLTTPTNSIEFQQILPRTAPKALLTTRNMRLFNH